MITYLIFTVIAVYILKFYFTTDPPKINRVYSPRGKWFTLKFWVFYVLLQIRKRQNKNQTVTSGEDAGYGKRSRTSVDEMERPQCLPKEHPKAVDAVYLNGANEKGEYLVAGLARRHDKLVQTLLYLRFPDIGLLELETLPDTSLKESEELSFAAGGLKFECVEPMKKWKMVFDGKMRLTKPNSDVVKILSVKFSLDWVAYTRYFDCDTDIHDYALCDAMAREVWTRNFFEQLHFAHQTHYEQFGESVAKVEIEGYGTRGVKLQGVRDHSYGNLRDWKDIHRYTLNFAHLEDGTAVCLSNICMPGTLSRLILGYVFHPNGKLDAISSSDFYLHEVGEDGNSPEEVQFNFVAGGKTYHLECSVQAMGIFYMGHEWEGRVHERLCTYKVNGIKGWGVSEWDYRNHTGKPNYYKKKD